MLNGISGPKQARSCCQTSLSTLVGGVGGQFQRRGGSLPDGSAAVLAGDAEQIAFDEHGKAAAQRLRGRKRPRVPCNSAAAPAPIVTSNGCSSIRSAVCEAGASSLGKSRVAARTLHRPQAEPLGFAVCPKIHSRYAL